jgi:multiple antibiotic resistance protein
MNLTILFKFFITLFAIINPISIFPIFLSYVKDLSTEEIKKQAIICGIAVFCILTVMLWLGASILGFFGIDENGFAFAGGLILIRLGLQFLDNIKKTDTSKHPSFAIYPLAIPLLAGPGAIATIILYAHQFSSLENLLSLNLILFCITISIIGLFYFTHTFKRVIGQNILTISTPLLGMLLVALGAEMIIRGIGQSFHWL